MLANVSDPSFLKKNDDLICILQCMISSKTLWKYKIFLDFFKYKFFFKNLKVPQKISSKSDQKWQS